MAYTVRLKRSAEKELKRLPEKIHDSIEMKSPKTITLREARKRTKLDLISDKKVHYYGQGLELVSVREGQRRTARLYPTHEQILKAAKKYFGRLGVELYPNGITVDGVGACMDFAIFQREKMTFVECLTEPWVTRSNIAKKRRVARYADLAFVIEEKPINEFSSVRSWKRFRQHVSNLAKKHKVYWWNSETASIRRCRPTLH